MENSRGNTNKKALIALALGGFGIGLTEFVIMGILPEISESLSISIPKSGHFIAAYALGVVVGAPVLAKISQHWSFKKALVALMLWFTLFNTLSGFSENYWTMLIFRFLSGLPHGAFFGIGAVASGYLAREGKAAQAMAVMFSGLTIANVIGVPLGTYIGQEWSWSYSFVLVGVAGLLTLLSLYLWMPNQKVEVPETSSNNRGLKSREFWALIALTTVGTGGFFAWYSYIAPLAIDIAVLTPYHVSYIMIVAGLGMVVGNFLGARLTQFYTPLKCVVISLTAMAITLVVNSAFSEYGTVVYIMSFLIGLITFSISTPLQMSIIQSAKGAENLASAMNQSAFNMGNASGAYLGGLPMVFGFGIPYSGYVGAVLATLGVSIGIAILYYQNIQHKRIQKEKIVSSC